jgi:hypothetical protein
VKFRIFLSIKIKQILLVCFILLVKLKGKCKVTTEVQRLIFFARRTNSSQHNNVRTVPPSPSPSRVAPSTSNNSSKPRVAAINSASRTPSATKSTPPPAEFLPSSGRARDIQCHKCKGFGHVLCDCSSKRVLVVKDDGEYSSASDFDEDTLALLAADHAGNDDHPEEHIGTGDTDHYESLIVQRVLSTQMESGAKSATHIVSNKVCHRRMVLSHEH